MSRLCSPLLDLTDEEAVLIPPDELDRLEAEALHRFRATRRYDHRQWGYLVETWNDATPEERQDRRDVCVRAGGHDWRRMPMDAVRVCQRCLTYRFEDPND